MHYFCNTRYCLLSCTDWGLGVKHQKLEIVRVEWGNTPAYTLSGWMGYKQENLQSKDVDSFHCKQVFCRRVVNGFLSILSNHWITTSTKFECVNGKRNISAWTLMHMDTYRKEACSEDTRQLLLTIRCENLTETWLYTTTKIINIMENEANKKVLIMRFPSQMIGKEGTLS